MRTLTLDLEQLRSSFKKHTVTATIECGGNRRADMKAMPAPSGACCVGAVGGHLLLCLGVR